MKNSKNPENVYIAGRILGRLEATPYGTGIFDFVLEQAANLAERDPDAMDWTEIDKIYACRFNTLSLASWSLALLPKFRPKPSHNIMAFMLKYALVTVASIFNTYKHNALPTDM